MEALWAVLALNWPGAAFERMSRLHAATSAASLPYVSARFRLSACKPLAAPAIVLARWLKSKSEKLPASGGNDIDMEAVKLTETTEDDAATTVEHMLVQHDDSCDDSWVS